MSNEPARDPEREENSLVMGFRACLNLITLRSLKCCCFGTALLLVCNSSKKMLESFSLICERKDCIREYREDRDCIICSERERERSQKD